MNSPLYPHMPAARLASPLIFPGISIFVRVIPVLSQGPLQSILVL